MYTNEISICYLNLFQNLWRKTVADQTVTHFEWHLIFLIHKNVSLFGWIFWRISGSKIKISGQKVQKQAPKFQMQALYKKISWCFYEGEKHMILYRLTMMPVWLSSIDRFNFKNQTKNNKNDRSIILILQMGLVFLFFSIKLYLKSLNKKSYRFHYSLHNLSYL